MDRRSEFNTQLSYTLRLSTVLIYFEHLVVVTLVLTNSVTV